jgi:hypothetical protein
MKLPRRITPRKVVNLAFINDNRVSNRDVNPDLGRHSRAKSAARRLTIAPREMGFGNPAASTSARRRM